MRMLSRDPASNLSVKYDQEISDALQGYIHIATSLRCSIIATFTPCILTNPASQRLKDGAV